MQTPVLTPRHYAVAVLAPLAMILLGVGCRQAGEQLANEALNPVTSAVNAVGKATITVAEEQARTHAAEDAVSEDVTVAMVLPEGADVPEGAELAKAAPACGQRIVYVRQKRAAATDDVVHDALVTLFSLQDGKVGVMADALKKAKLSVEKINVEAGVTNIWLKGDLSAADPCALSLAKAQLESTIGRFKTKFKIYLNGSEETYAKL